MGFARICEVKGKLGNLEDLYAKLSVHANRIDASVWRIEQRLELIEA